MNLDELSYLKLLYIEDEQKIRESLSNALSMIFENVIAVSSAEEALESIKSEKIDIILSDITLPGISGIELSKKVREKNRSIPIILLTAHTDTDILIEATKLKLTNYLVKPINLDDLLESFKLALRDIKEIDKKLVYLPNNLLFNINNETLTQDGKEIDLTSNEVIFLKLLVKNLGKTTLTEEIKDTIWNDYYKATDSALKSLLNKLRKKIGNKTIKNVSGVGYYLVTK